MDNYNWSLVKSGAPYVTVSSLGISFNPASIDKLGRPEQILLGFDESTLVLAAKAYQDEPAEPYEFASRVKNGWVRLSCKDFVRYLESLTGLEFYPAKRYVAKWDAKNDLMLIDTKNPINSDEDENENHEN